MDEKTRRLLGDVRRDLSAAADEISEAVSVLEGDGDVTAEDLLGGALSRLRILDARIERYLDRADSA